MSEQDSPDTKPARILPDWPVVGTQEIHEAVFQALGAASVCWEPMDCTGVFMSERAEQIGDELLTLITLYAQNREADRAEALRDGNWRI